MSYALAADLLVLLHVAVVAFIVGGQVLILVGWAGRRPWARNPLFRWSHLAAILFIAGETWLGRLCPLTAWEAALRRRAGQTAYPGDFVAHWLERLLYWTLPHWAFLAAYTGFALLVVVSFLGYPPRQIGGKNQSAGS